MKGIKINWCFRFEIINYIQLHTISEKLDYGYLIS